MSELTLTDMFCGAGGSSTGAVSVPGIKVRTAMNHWARAIETHNRNHPNTAHVQADISQTDPRYVAHSDILWASPECTNHSVAKGRKRITNQPDLFGDHIADEAADRSRATMWDVPRFAEFHDYRLIITENVVDAAKWVMFDAWLSAMHSLGYLHHIVYLNSMHAQLGGLPAPQSRDRMYVFFWKKGNKRPNFDRLRPKAYCPGCDQVVTSMQAFKKPNQRWGRYRAQYVYRCPNVSCRNQIIEPAWLPAAAAIDWTIQGQRIGDREKPLAEKTMARIRAGLEKYGRQPVAVDAVRGAQILSAVEREPFQTQTTSYTRGLLVPVEGREGKEAADIMEALRTQTTRNETGVLIPAGGGLCDGRGPRCGEPSREDVFNGIYCACERPIVMPEAYLVRNNNVAGDPGYLTTPASEPMRTLTTSGHQSLLMPYYGSSRPQGVDRPIGTLTTVDRYAMITLRGQNAPKDVYDPLDTFAANGQHHGIMGVTPPKVEDCTFRMLEPHEITAGMAFPKSYVMTGNKREQVKQAGNAVTPPAARDLVTIGAESLGVAA